MIKKQEELFFDLLSEKKTIKELESSERSCSLAIVGASKEDDSKKPWICCQIRCTEQIK